MNEIIKFEDNDFILDIQVTPEEDTVWLTQKEMLELFEKDRKTITRHIQNIFKEKESLEKEVCSRFEHTTQHGTIKGESQTREVQKYNLDMIISVGYRVKSKRGIKFRKWVIKYWKIT